MATNNVTLPGTGEVVSTDVLTTLNGVVISTGEEAQRMKVAWGGVGAGTDTTSDFPFPTSQNGVYFITSLVNSTVAQLASGATFVGTVESTVGQPALSWLVVSDQPLVITISQYIDLAGTQKVKDIFRYIEAGKGFSESMVLNGDYIKFTVKNIGLATTTTLNVNVGYGTINTADDQGNLPVIVAGSDDYSGNSLLELCINGDLALHTKAINPENRDINGSQIPSDSPAVPRIVASVVGQQFLIDTQGYQTLSVTMGTMAATVTGSNDTGGTFGAVSCFPVVLGAPVSTAAAATNYIIPCFTRYIKLTVTTIGWAAYNLRQQPLPAPYLANAPVNLTQYLGAAASSTNPQHVTALALAATNNQTIPAINVVTATAPAATVIKATAGRLTMLAVSNGAANVAYLHLYNAASVTLGTTVSVMVFAIPATAGAIVSVPLPDGGLFFSTGICYAFTGAAASLDNTALTAPTLIANLAFI